MHKVTIAIPIYNTKDYIRESLLSALNQTYRNIEYLIINDKGTDNSIDIVHEFSNNHSRGKEIRIITHKKNLGIAEARNTALREAKGEYLFFLDSDDTITPDCIEILYKKVTEYSVDFVAASYQKVNENNEIFESIKYPNILIKGINKIAEYYFNSYKYEPICTTVWNKLYRVSFLRENKIQCIPNRLYEDVLFTFNLILKAESCAIIPDILYSYKIRKNSIMQHNPRSIIPIKEFEDHFFYKEFIKNESHKYNNTAFYESMITRTMVNCFNDIRVVVKKKKMISETVPSKKIKKILSYPITFKEICKFRNYRTLNILLFIFSKLPYWIEIIIIKLYNNSFKNRLLALLRIS